MNRFQTLLVLGLAAASAAVAEPDAPRYELAFDEPRLVTPLAAGDARRPVVVYYAVDSGERFMQVTVDYEVRALREACATHRGNPAVNWVAFLNSWHVARDGFFLYCRAGELGQSRLASDGLAARLAWLGTYDRSDFLESQRLDLPSMIPFEGSEISFPPEVGRAFQAHPLADWVTLEAAIRATTRLFPEESHIPFLHLKSHGSEALALSALTPEIIAARAEEEASFLRSLALDDDALPDVVYGEAGLGPATATELTDRYPGLARAGLGPVGFGAWGVGEDAGSADALHNLAAAVEGALGFRGSMVAGEAGVGGVEGRSGFEYFGTGKRELERVFRGVSWRDKAWGFAFFESCHSRLFPDKDENLSLAAHYSARGTMWYRNVDWPLVFDELVRRGGRAATLQELLLNWTRKIPTFVRKAPLAESEAARGFYDLCTSDAAPESARRTIARIVHQVALSRTVDAASCRETAERLARSWYLDLSRFYWTDEPIEDLSPLATLPHITQLSLAGNDVRDVSPLAALEGLAWLDLSGNPIERGVEALESLASLESLALELAHGTLPPRLSGLPSLATLIVSADDLNTLSFLEGSPSLRVLDVSFAKLRDVSAVAGLAALEKLRLQMRRWGQDGTQGFATFPVTAGSPLTDLSVFNRDLERLDELASYSALERLEVRVNQHEGEPVRPGPPLEPLATLAGLSRLELTDPYALEALAPLTRLPRLERLELRCLDPDTTHMRGLPRLAALEHLLLRVPMGDQSCHASRPSLDGLQRLGRLTSFEARNQPLGFLGGLRALRQLRHVTLESAAIRDVSTLEGMVRLETLRLDMNRFVDVEPLGSLRNLRVLELPGTVESVAPLARLPDDALAESTFRGIVPYGVKKDEAHCPTDRGPLMLREACRRHYEE